MADEAAHRVETTLPIRVLQAVVGYWLLLKVVALFVGQPHADEAYYWVWGQHLALSYLDHPPLHAWLQGAVSTVLGWNLFALRFLSIVATAATLWILFVWARRLQPDNWQPAFWLSSALFYSAPLMMLYTTVALHDRLLVLFALLSLHFFAWFFADWTEGRRRYGALYLAAVFLGLATLTKYNGALLGVGFALVILSRRDLWSLLRSPHLYLAAALSVLMQAPVLYWNSAEGFASAHLHLDRGFEGFETGIQHVIRVSLETVLLISPFAIAPIVRFFAARREGGFGGMLLSSGKWIFVVSTLSILALALFREALFYWNILAFTAFFGVAAWSFRSRWEQALQIVWGVLLSTALYVQFSVVPFMTTPDAKGLYGWEEIAARVKAAEAAQQSDFTAAADWSQASRLAYELRDKDVASISAIADGYDFWFDESAHAGKSAIVVMEKGDPRRVYVARRFDSMEKLEDFTVERFGQVLATYELYVGRGYVAGLSGP